MAFTPGMERSVEVQVQSSGVEGFNSAMAGSKAGLLSFGAAVGAAGAALSALAAGGMAAAIGAAREFETAMVEVERVSNEEVAGNLRGEIMSLAEEIPLAQEELAGLAADAARFGVEGTENVRRFTETVSRMAVATDLAAGEAGEALARLSELTNTPIEQIENLGAAVNSLGNNFATSQSEIVDAMLRSSAALSQLGLQQTEIAGLSAAINEVSESSRRAGTRLRRLGQELLNPDKLRSLSDAVLDTTESFAGLTERGIDLRMQFADQSAELTRYQDQLRETNDELQGLSDAHEELGDSIRDNRIKIKEIRLEARKEGRDLTEEEKAQIEELRTENEEFRLEQLKNKDAQEDLKDEREEQKAAVEEQQAAVEQTRDAFAEEFETMRDESPLVLIRAIAEAMGEGGEQADAFRRELSSASQQAAAGLAQNLEGVDNAVALSGESFDEASSLQREFNKVQDTTDSQMQLLRNRLKNVAITTGDALLPAFNDLLGGFNKILDPLATVTERTDGMATALGLAGLAVGGLAAAIAAFVSGPAAALFGAAAAIAAAWTTNFLGIRDTVMGALDELRDEFEAVREALMTIVEATVGGIQEAWSEHGEEVLQNVRAAVGAVVGVFRRLAEFVLNRIMLPFLESLAGLYETHFAELVTETLETFNVLAARFRAFVDFVMPLWELFGDEILAVLEFVFDTLRVVVVTALDSLISTFRIFLALLRGDWGEALDILLGLWTRTFDRVFGFAEGWGGRLLSWLDGLTDGFVRGIRDMWGTVTSAFSTALSDLLDDVRSWAEDVGAAVVEAAEAIGTAIRAAINDALGLPFEESIGAVSVQGQQVFGGETIRIPALAEGGIVQDASLVMAGEQGPEAVVPLDRLDEMTAERGPETVVPLDRLDELGAAGGAAQARVTVDVSMPQGGGMFAQALQEIVSVEVEDQLGRLNRQLERREQRREI
jgi:TP901 family phage tail tape measure protein